MTTLTQEQTTELITYLEAKGTKRFTVSLHLHFDQDPDYDYRGEHVIYITSFEGYNENGQKCYHDKFIDLEGMTENECYSIVDQVYKIVKSYDSSAVKKEFIHK